MYIINKNMQVRDASVFSFPSRMPIIVECLVERGSMKSKCFFLERFQFLGSDSTSWPTGLKGLKDSKSNGSRIGSINIFNSDSWISVYKMSYSDNQYGGV